MILIINCDMTVEGEVHEDALATFNSNAVWFQKKDNKFIINGQKCCLPEEYMKDVLNLLHEIFDFEEYKFTYIPDEEVYFVIDKKHKEIERRLV